MGDRKEEEEDRDNRMMVKQSEAEYSVWEKKMKTNMRNWEQVECSNPKANHIRGGAKCKHKKKKEIEQKVQK